MEHLSVNVEASLVKILYDEGLVLAAESEAARARALEVMSEAEKVEDPFERARVQQKARAILLEHRRLFEKAEKHALLARQAVARADSLDEKTVKPADVEPETRTPLTKKELDERERWRVESAWRYLRDERDAKLAASDRTQIPDAPFDQEAWASYRQKLRDLPASTKDPTKISWPDPPK